jgi:hypothetical protein
MAKKKKVLFFASYFQCHKWEVERKMFCLGHALNFQALCLNLSTWPKSKFLLSTSYFQFQN